ncbi:MAG: hypothetical protein ACI9R3_000330 [Verrucomicrobiales bacterium]|jgi:hypothetical protein
MHFYSRAIETLAAFTPLIPLAVYLHSQSIGRAIVSFLISSALCYSLMIGSNSVWYTELLTEYERTGDPEFKRRYLTDASDQITAIMGLVIAPAWNLIVLIPGMMMVRYCKKRKRITVPE